MDGTCLIEHVTDEWIFLQYHHNKDSQWHEYTLNIDDISIEINTTNTKNKQIQFNKV